MAFMVGAGSLNGHSWAAHVSHFSWTLRQLKMRDAFLLVSYSTLGDFSGMFRQSPMQPVGSCLAVVHRYVSLRRNPSIQGVISG